MNDLQKKNEFILLLILATILIAITGAVISQKTDFLKPAKPATSLNDESSVLSVTIQNPTLKTALNDLDSINPNNLDNGLSQINNEISNF